MRGAKIQKTVQNALLPPSLTTSVTDYKAYLVNYKLYQAELSAIKAEVSQGRKDLRDRQREASSRGQVLSVKKTVSYRDVVVGTVSVKEPVVTKTITEKPARINTPASPESKKAKTVAKRRRYKSNLKLRKAKKAAELSKWQLVTAKNEERRKKALSPKKTPEPAKKASAATEPKGTPVAPAKAQAPPTNRPNPPKAQKTVVAPQQPRVAAAPAAKKTGPREFPIIPELLRKPDPAPKRDQFSKPLTSGFVLKNVGSYLGDQNKREKYQVLNATGVTQCHTVVPAVRAAIGGMIKPGEEYPLTEAQWSAIRKYHADNKLPI